jgi:alginate O-acetyltransferase complex protein AlgJ
MPDDVPARSVLDDPDPIPGRRPRRRGSWLDLLVSVGFVIGLFVPGVALIAGFRPAAIENRDPSTLPPVGIDGVADGSFFAAIDRFVTDNFPLRTVAVRVQAAIDYGVLGGTTNPDVMRGTDDWLFLTGELRPRCDFDVDTLLTRVDEAAVAFERAGKPFRYVVVPDKHSIYPEHVQPYSLAGSCTDAQRERLRAGMQARPGVAVELWTGLLAAKQRDPSVPLYYVQDAHWTTLGATVGIRSLVESLAPGTWDDAEVVVGGDQRHSSDLASLIGLPRVEIVPRVEMRPGVKADKRIIDPGVDIHNSRDIPWFTVRTDRPIVPGRTLFVYDSFFATQMSFFVPWFEESVWVHEGDLFNEPEIGLVLPEFDNVVFQRIERSALFTDPASDLRTIIARLR